MNQAYGVKMICDVLRGISSSEITELGFDSLSTYGIMKDYSEDKIRGIIHSLIFQRYINTSEDRLPILSVSKSSAAVLKGKERVFAQLLKEEKTQTNENEINTGLLMKLKDLRKNLASRASVPSYVIFTDAALNDMCRKKPKTLVEFSSVSGVGAAKLDKYGEFFIKAIREYEENNPGT